MKINLQLSSLIFFIALFQNVKAQNLANQTFISSSRPPLFIKVPLRNAELNSPANDALKRYMVLKDSTKDLTSQSTLHTFFSKKISSYLSEASDISLSKVYAVLDNTDGRLFLAANLFSKTDQERFKRHFLTAGVKFNIDEGFASIRNSDGFAKDIGASLKYTWLGKGIITSTKNDRAAVAKKRNSIANSWAATFDKDVTDYKGSETGSTTYSQDVDKFIKSYGSKNGNKFSSVEADYIEDKGLYTSIRNYWISIDGYAPITKSEYSVADNFKTTALSQEKYRPFELNLAGTLFWQKNRWHNNKISNFWLLPGLTMLTAKFSVVANNSVNAKMLNEYSYDTYLTQNNTLDTTSMAKLNSESVYVGKFENFLTPRLSGRYVYMPFSFAGVSVAVEKNFGKIDNFNWKLGLPVSLKDNEGKAKVNFEVVWRRLNGERGVGISVGLPLGGALL